jgi:hypothetical protein
MTNAESEVPQIETNRDELLLRAGFPESALPKPGFEKRRIGAFDAYVGLQYLAAFGCWDYFRDLRGGEIYPADTSTAFGNKRAMEWNKILYRAYDRQEMDGSANCFALVAVAADDGAEVKKVKHYLYDPVPIRVFKKGDQYFFEALEAALNE